MTTFTRREAIKCFGAGAVAGILSQSLLAATPPTGRRPNILMLVADDQQAGTIGAMGQRQVLTPHLDALAKAGMIFTNACNMGSTCGPVCNRVSPNSSTSGRLRRRPAIWPTNRAMPRPWQKCAARSINGPKRWANVFKTS